MLPSPASPYCNPCCCWFLPIEFHAASAPKRPLPQNINRLSPPPRPKWIFIDIPNPFLSIFWTSSVLTLSHHPSLYPETRRRILCCGNFECYFRSHSQNILEKPSGHRTSESCACVRCIIPRFTPSLFSVPLSVRLATDTRTLRSR